MQPNLPADANDAWGYDGNRLVYLVRVVKEDETDICHVCSETIKHKKDELDDAREKHFHKHRVWKYADSGELYAGGLKQHRFCLHFDPKPTWLLSFEEACRLLAVPMWHRECGGYIRILP